MTADGVVPPRIERAARTRVWDHEEATMVLGADGSLRRFDGDSAAVCRAVLDHLGVPRTRREVLDHLNALAGASPHTESVLDALLTQLRAAGAVRDVDPTHLGARWTPGGPSSVRNLGARVVLGVTGAVATAHTPALVMALQRRGMTVRVAATRRALRFVRTEALTALTHAGVAVGLWGGAGEPAAHVALADWADLVLVAPASATTLGRIAGGMFTDAVSATAGLARGNDVPVVLAPSMNPGMLRTPAVQRNLDTLRTDGYRVVHPVRGVEVADDPSARRSIWGPSPPGDDLAAIVDAVLAGSRRAGPPREPLDWERLYSAGDPHALPWSTHAPDAVFRDALAALAPLPGTAIRRLLDVGTGTGVAAREAAAMGCSVVATDVSATALRVARTAIHGERVTWLLDDILATALRGTFDVVHDRGCLHALPVERHGAYAAAVAALCAPGGTLLLTTHAPGHAGGEPQARGTVGFSPAGVTVLLGRWFTVESSVEVPFAGPPGIVRRGLFSVLRRRG